MFKDNKWMGYLEDTQSNSLEPNSFIVVTSRPIRRENSVGMRSLGVVSTSAKYQR